VVWLLVGFLMMAGGVKDGAGHNVGNGLEHRVMNGERMVSRRGRHGLQHPCRGIARW
jgi:hypothetical protein